MVSIKTIYSRAFAVLRKKPFLLWGISLLAMLLSALSVPLLGVIPAASIAVSMLLQTAMTLIYLRGYRGEEIAVTQLFDTFKDWKTVKRVLCGMGWASLWIFLWSLIPVAGIVFGIIRTYEYRLTPYILMHEPDVPITEAIKVSREKTRGYKARMFGADALYVVVIAAAEILLALLATIPYIGVLFGILSVVFTIAASLFGPLFLGLVQAAFYEEITHRRVCPRCGVELSPDARFCYNCGYGADGNTGSTPELPAAVVCPQCGAPVKPGTVFCGQCGCRINGKPGIRNEPSCLAGRLVLQKILRRGCNSPRSQPYKVYTETQPCEAKGEKHNERKQRNQPAPLWPRSCAARKIPNRS